MATTCKLIQKVVLGSSAASIDFTSIPSTFDDLYCIMSLRSDHSGLIYDAVRLRFNGAASDTNHSCRYIQGNGSAASSQSLSLINVAVPPAASATANTFGNSTIYIPNYAGSAAKSLSNTDAHETNGSTAYMTALAGLWNDTSAITSFKLESRNSANFVAGSSAYLYGITKA